MENVKTNSLNTQKELNVHTDTVKEEDTMTTEKLKNYLENMKALERSIENHQRNLSELRSRTFEQYIEQESYRAHKYGIRVKSSRIADPTAYMGIYGREAFEKGRQSQIDEEERKLRAKKHLYKRIHAAIGKLSTPAKEIITRRYLEGEKIEEIAKTMGLSRATGFRRLNAALEELTRLFEMLQAKGAA